MNKLTPLFLLLILISATCHAATVTFPQPRQAGAARADISDDGKTVTLCNDLLSATFSSRNGKTTFDGSPSMHLLPGTELFTITLQDSTVIKASDMTIRSWQHNILEADTSATVASHKLPGHALRATLSLNGLQCHWEAVLRDGSHYLRTKLTVSSDSDITIHAITPMLYAIDSNLAPQTVGNTRGAVLLSPTIFAGLETPTAINSILKASGTNSPDTIRGLWSRHTTLQASKPWVISSVVGLVAPGQPRRSFLAYSERERAVPWRPFPHYNSWYELNIDRNNSPTYEGHMTADDCVRIVRKWKKRLFDENNAAIKAFVWDDGWDSYGTWTFNPGFPNGFKEPYEIARQTGAGTGAWLGPVGGYGTSGDMRRKYWLDKGGMQLSNPAYYQVFLEACSDMVKNYDFNFFKLDGISAQFSSVGPDEGYRGEENAEGIIDILSAVRRIRPDMFFNTTVGTWASPFWFHFTDAIWRQEQDYGEIGDQGSDRERWITYRDRLVYQNFVENSPICPINTLMTHGVILTSHGDVAKSMDYDGVVRELRCAFACGSSMVELYCDSALLDTINGGALWTDIAECIRWQEKNADVLPDSHWIGGNPWDGAKANVYGWASWNDRKATLAMRNPSEEAQTFTFTPRSLLEIPDYDNRPIMFQPAFRSQNNLAGFPAADIPLPADTPISVVLPPLSVFVFDGAY